MKPARPQFTPPPSANLVRARPGLAPPVRQDSAIQAKVMAVQAARLPVCTPAAQTVQMAGMFSFYGASPLRTLGNVFQDRSWQSLKDVYDVRRWRLNPMNIAAGIRNGREENLTANLGGYHTSTRHGAHNTTGNSRARLTSQMNNQYAGGVVNAPPGAGTPQGRFNSESWENFSWRKAKEQFAAVAGTPVTWVMTETAARAASGTVGNVPPKQACTFTLRHKGSDVGLMQTATADVSVAGVHVAINYFPHGGTIYAWNGQMYPRAATVGVAPPPPTTLATLNGNLVDIPYERFG